MASGSTISTVPMLNGLNPAQNHPEPVMRRLATRIGLLRVAHRRSPSFTGNFTTGRLRHAEILRMQMLRITPSERSALQLLAEGKATEDLAACLGVSASDTEHHLARLFARMGAADRREAIAVAVHRGLLDSAGIS